MISRRHALSAPLALLTFGGSAGAADRLAEAGAALRGGRVESELDTLHAQDRFAGVVLAVVDGRPVLERAWGMADRERGVANTIDTRFNIASAGKMFTTVAIGQLLQARELALDDTVERYVPGLRNPIAARATIAQLLSHQSGLGSYFSAPGFAGNALQSVGDYLALVESEPADPAYAGGYRYSNSGYIVLGAVIERIGGRDFYEHIRERVFAPAGMNATDYPQARPEGGAIGYENGCFARPPSQCTPQTWRAGVRADRGSPAGGCFSTARDLNAFIEALKGERLLARSTLELLKAERGRMERPGGPIDAYGLGFGRLTVHGCATWGHNGGTPGYQAQIDVVEDVPLTLIVLCNQDGGQRAASAALRRCLAGPA